MEAWFWLLVLAALVLLAVGTLRFDLLAATLRERLGGRREAPMPERPHTLPGHAAAAHTGHVSAHTGGKRRPVFHRSGKRH
jgi:hypothetical protein